jgi:hypothetical protein
MSAVGLIFVIGLPVLACASVIVAELTGHLARTLPTPQRTRDQLAVDVDAMHRAALAKTFPPVPPHQGDPS